LGEDADVELPQVRKGFRDRAIDRGAAARHDEGERAQSGPREVELLLELAARDGMVARGAGKEIHRDPVADDEALAAAPRAFGEEAQLLAVRPAREGGGLRRVDEREPLDRLLRDRLIARGRVHL